MATRHEAPKPKIPQLHFAPEGYVSSSDPEYLDQLLEELKAAHFDPDQLVFSGFNGRDLAEGSPLPRHDAIYVMNAAGWREAIAHPDGVNASPAEYAERWHETGAPCVGLYDKNQLVHVYSHGAPEHPENLIERDHSESLRYGGVQLEVPDDRSNPDVETRHLPKPYDEYIEEREEFTDIVPGVPLAEVPVDEPLETPVVHKDFPEGSPTDALVGVVFLEEPAPSKKPFGF